MGNWYENMQAGADRARLRETEVQADEDRDRRIQADIVAAEYKKTEAAYLANLRKNQLADQKAAADARAKALKVAEANEQLARELTVTGSPIGGDEPWEGEFQYRTADNEPYAGVADFDVKTETESLVRLDEDGNVIEGGFKTDAEVTAEKNKLKKLKAREIIELKNDIIKAEEERKNAEPVKRAELNEKIAEINAQIKDLEAPGAFTEEKLKELDPEASQATRIFAGSDARQELTNRLQVIGSSLIELKHILPWYWDPFLPKSEYDEKQLKGELGKWLQKKGKKGIVGGYQNSHANDWFQIYGEAELERFEGNPLDYYARNKEAIEKESGVKLNIPSSEEITTVIANDPGAKVRREEEITKLKQSLGINEKELEALGGAVDDPDQFSVLEADIVTKYEELFEDLQDATDERNAALIKKIKSQIINSPPHRLLNNQSFGTDINHLTEERSTLLQLFNTASSSGQLEQALTIKMAITTIDKRLWNKLVDRGILDLQTNGDGEILEAAMSQHMGRMVRFQKRSDGNFHFFVQGDDSGTIEPKFDLYQNPKTKKEYWTQEQISAKVSYEVNEGFEAAQKEFIASIAKKKVEGMLTDVEAAKLYNALIIQVEGDKAAMQREKLKDAGATFGPMDTNTGNFIMRAGGSFYLMRSDPKVIDGTETTEARFEKLDIPTMLGIALSGNDKADAAMRAWFASIGLAGFNSAGLKLQ